MISKKRAFLNPILLLLPFVAFVSSCDGVFGIGEDKRIGVIAFHSDPVVVAVPDSVQAAESFEVSVRTYGGGCHRENGTEVKARGLSADITPYDIHSGASVCTDILNMFDHTATLTFNQPGIAQITFHGMQVPEDQRISVIRQVVVK